MLLTIGPGGDHTRVPCSSQSPPHPALLPHLTLMPPTQITVTYLWGLGLWISLHLDYPSALCPPSKISQTPTQCSRCNSGGAQLPQSGERLTLGLGVIEFEPHVGRRDHLKTKKFQLRCHLLQEAQSGASECCLDGMSYPSLWGTHRNAARSIFHICPSICRCVYILSWRLTELCYVCVFSKPMRGSDLEQVISLLGPRCLNFKMRCSD